MSGSISGKARVAGVMGWPVGHSRSPRLHGHWLAQYAVDGAYVPFAVPPDGLERALRALPALGVRGVNLTIPHKEAALALMDRLDASAARIGAVNTVVVGEDGSLEGRNTDAYGFIENLRQNAGAGWQVPNGPALVLGAGGAARAVLVALADAGVPLIRLANRTRARAQALADALGPHLPCPLQVVEWDAIATVLADTALLVNTTSLGMSGQPPLALSLCGLRADALVSDIVYTPLLTPLLADAQARGHATVDGLGMLLHQARPGFHAWFGIDPAVTPALRRAVLDA